MASDKENTRQQFTFRREWYEIASCFDQSVRLEIYDMIMEKVFSGEVTFTYSAMATGAFKAISFQIDSDKKRLEEISEKRKEAGRIGGKANGSKDKQNQANGSKTKQTEAKQANASFASGQPQQQPTTTRGKVFQKPTIEEIRAYIAEKGYHFSAEQFFAFYESKGWKVGSQPMKDWKMACVTWEGRTGNRAQQQSQSQQPRKTTFNDWNSSEALTEQYKIDEERRMKQQDDEEKEERVRSFQVQILDYFSRHRDDYKTLEQGDVKENDYFTITGLPDGTMYWNCKCANCKRRTYYDEAMKCVNECPLDAPMRPKGDEDTSYIWDKVSKMWVIY